MINIDFKTLARVTAGKLVNDEFAATRFNGVSIDTRSIENQNLFIAIVGETNDGHNFIDSAIEKNCAGLIVSEKYDLSNNNIDKIPVVIVNDTHQALIDLAMAYRKSVNATYIAITGSNGKTTTKDITYAFINSHERGVYRSQGNFNNLYGLPLSILAMPEDTRYGVFELGISTPGEMARLSKILYPDMTVITNIGPTHLETLGTVENVAKEKFSMIDNSSPNHPAILNIDDPYIATEAFKRERPFLTFGLSPDADITAENDGIDEHGYPKYKIKKRSFSVPLFGDYQIYNILAAAAVCRELGFFPTADDFQKLEFPRSAHRGQIEVLEDLTVIDDCYNANPVSMKAGLDTFKRYSESAGDKYCRKIAVLGDMLELGEKEIEYHRQIGDHISQLNIDLVVTVGKLAENIGLAAVEGGLDKSMTHSFADSDTAGKFLIGNTLRGDIAYLKASRGIALEKIIEMARQKLAGKS